MPGTSEGGVQFLLGVCEMLVRLMGLLTPALKLPSQSVYLVWVSLM